MPPDKTPSPGDSQVGRGCNPRQPDGNDGNAQEARVINKIYDSLASAVAGVHDGATIMIGGFGNAGMPSALINALIEQGARDLTIVNNNAGNGETGLAALL